jgi:peptidoglycan/LPS O-acetylase OafA/YrhL
MDKAARSESPVRTPGFVSLASVLVALQGLTGMIYTVVFYASPDRMRGMRGFEHLGTGALAALVLSVVLLIVADALSRLRGWAYVAALGFEGLLFATLVAYMVDQSSRLSSVPVGMLPVIGVALGVISLLANPSSRRAFAVAARQERVPEPQRHRHPRVPGGRLFI